MTSALRRPLLHGRVSWLAAGSSRAPTARLLDGSLRHRLRAGRLVIAVAVAFKNAHGPPARRQSTEDRPAFTAGHVSRRQH